MRHLLTFTTLFILVVSANAADIQGVMPDVMSFDVIVAHDGEDTTHSLGVFSVAPGPSAGDLLTSRTVNPSGTNAYSVRFEAPESTPVFPAPQSFLLRLYVDEVWTTPSAERVVSTVDVVDKVFTTTQKQAFVEAVLALPQTQQGAGEALIRDAAVRFYNANLRTRTQTLE